MYCSTSPNVPAEDDQREEGYGLPERTVVVLKLSKADHTRLDGLLKWFDADYKKAYYIIGKAIFALLLSQRAPKKSLQRTMMTQMTIMTRTRIHRVTRMGPMIPHGRIKSQSGILQG